jgi:hypothetical protein
VVGDQALVGAGPGGDLPGAAGPEAQLGEGFGGRRHDPLPGLLALLGSSGHDLEIIQLTSERQRPRLVHIRFSIDK